MTPYNWIKSKLQKLGVDSKNIVTIDRFKIITTILNISWMTKGPSHNKVYLGRGRSAHTSRVLHRTNVLGTNDRGDAILL